MPYMILPKSSALGFRLLLSPFLGAIGSTLLLETAILLRLISSGVFSGGQIT